MSGKQKTPTLILRVGEKLGFLLTDCPFLFRYGYRLAYVIRLFELWVCNNDSFRNL